MPANRIEINRSWEFIVGDSQMGGLIRYLRTISSGESRKPLETPITDKRAANTPHPTERGELSDA